MSIVLLTLLSLDARAGGACGGHVAAIQKLRASSCKIEMVTANCRSVFEAAPETLRFARDCQDDMGDKEVTVLGACARAVGSAWTSLYREVASSVGTNKAIIDECESDPKLTCKRRLALEAYFKYGSDDDLRDTSTIDLLRKRDSVRALAARDRAYRAKLEAAHVPLGEPRDGVADGVLAAAKRQLTDLKVKTECYNAAGYANLICHAIASLADPSFAVAGVILSPLKAGRWAAAVLSGEKIEAAIAKGGLSEGAAATADLPPGGPVKSEVAKASAAGDVGRETSVGQSPGNRPREATPWDTDSKRAIDRAQRHLGRELTADEQKCLVKAHLVGAEDPSAYNDNYPREMKLRKGRILMGCGFSRAQAQTILDRGIAGKTPTLAAVPVIDTDAAAQLELILKSSTSGTQVNIGAKALKKRLTDCKSDCAGVHKDIDAFYKANLDRVAKEEAIDALEADLLQRSTDPESGKKAEEYYYAIAECRGKFATPACARHLYNAKLFMNPPTTAQVFTALKRHILDGVDKMTSLGPTTHEKFVEMMTDNIHDEAARIRREKKAGQTQVRTNLKMSVVDGSLSTILGPNPSVVYESGGKIVLVSAVNDKKVVFDLGEPYFTVQSKSSTAREYYQYEVDPRSQTLKVKHPNPVTSSNDDAYVRATHFGY